LGRHIGGALIIVWWRRWWDPWARFLSLGLAVSAALFAIFAR
jgi:hypothetical protein